MSALEGPLPVRTAEDPAVHRRTLVLGALAGIGATAVAGGGRPATAAARHHRRTTAYAAAAWRPLTGHVLPTPHGRVRLASVTEHGDEVFEAFRLTFVTMDARPMPEQLDVGHPRHGRVHFLLTTAGAAGVAVVNRRRS